MRLRPGPLDRQILALALPATAALAADPLLSLVDTALVGRLGNEPLAALGICAAVFTTAVLLIAAPAILRVMGATPAVAEQGLVYLRIRALAAVPLLVIQVGHGAFRGLHDTRTPLVVAVIANVVNGVVSWLLIYPAGLGIAGAAIGTVTAEVGAAAAFLVLGSARFSEVDLRVDRVAMAAIVRVSRDLFLRTASLLAGLLITTAIAARMGTVVVAAHQIARELWSMLALVLDGFAIAGQAMIASALGAGDVDRAVAHSRRIVGWGLAGGLGIGLLYLSLGGVLPGVFSTDATVIGAVAGVWVLVAVLQPVGGIVFTLDGILMGAGDFKFLFASTAAAALGALVPVCLVALALGWGLRGVWAGMAAMMVVRLVTLVWRWRSRRWAVAT